MILSTILNHFRLKRRIRQAADDLQDQFAEDPVHEAKMRSFCHSGAQMHFWTRVATELDNREAQKRPRPLTTFTIRREAMLKRERDKRDNGSAA